MNKTKIKAEIVADNHSSETALDLYDKFDHIIENDGSIQDLIEQIRVILITNGIN